MQSKSHGDISDGDVQHFIEAIDQNDDNLISKVRSPSASTSSTGSSEIYH